MTASDDDLPTQIQPSPAAFDKPHQAASMGDGNSLPIGTRLAEFELTRTLGEGGFGIVYLAMDHSLQRKVALKEYMPSQLASRGAGTSVSVKAERYRDTFEAGLKSFINEARLLAQFDHPALVKVYRFWEANGTAYMVMPFYCSVPVIREQSRCSFSRIESAVAVQRKGWQFSLWEATKWSMRCTSCLTLSNEPRRIALSVMSAKKRSTWFSHEL